MRGNRCPIGALLANRTNASKSTGPQTADGKAAASRNALRHGLRSNQLLLDGEDPEEFAELQADLLDALAPVGAVELSLAERIVIAIWRQRRLARAEAAALALERRDDALLEGLRGLHDYDERDEITETCLEPFDAELVEWCQAVLDEVEALNDYTLEELEKSGSSCLGPVQERSRRGQRNARGVSLRVRERIERNFSPICAVGAGDNSQPPKSDRSFSSLSNSFANGDSFCRLRNSTSWPAIRRRSTISSIRRCEPIARHRSGVSRRLTTSMRERLQPLQTLPRELGSFGKKCLSQGR